MANSGFPSPVTNGGRIHVLALRMRSPNNIRSMETVSNICYLLQTVLSSKESSAAALSLATWQFGFCEFLSVP